MMWKTLGRHLGGIVLTWIVVLACTLWLLRSYSQPSSQREVPALTGMLRQQAQDTLLLLGLNPIWQDSIYAAGGRPGSIVEQHPPAGSAVKAGRNILLTSYRITPPDERVDIEEGQDARLAERILATRGFEVVLVEEPNKLLAGKVIRVRHTGRPLANQTRLPRGSVLELVVGVVGARDVRVPWLVGLSLEDAEAVLGRRKLALGHVGYEADIQTALDSSLAVVVSQDASPAKTPRLEEGTAVDLYLGKH